MTESPLDWKARLLHPLNRRVQENVLGAVAARPDRWGPITDAAAGAAAVFDQLTRSEVWDLPDAGVALEVARLALSVPFVERIAPESVPVAMGVLRLPPDVAGPDSGPGPGPEDAGRRLLADFADWGEGPNRVVGLAWGPAIGTYDDDGARTLSLSVSRIIEIPDPRVPGGVTHVVALLGFWPVPPSFAPTYGEDPDRFVDVPASTVIGRDGPDGADGFWERATALRFLLALWALADSGALEAGEVRDRHAVKRARRAGSVNDKVVQVVVPHARSSGGSGTGAGGSVVAHWVRGHWRWQPVGPGRQDRRLTWIRPHTRGSVGDAPDAPGEKVVIVRDTE